MLYFRLETHNYTVLQISLVLFAGMMRFVLEVSISIISIGVCYYETQLCLLV